MALSLSSQQLQVTNTPPLSNKPLSLPTYSATPRPFTSVILHDKAGQETFSMRTAESALLTPSSHARHVLDRDAGDNLTSSSPVQCDLPSWTPLKPPRGDQVEASSIVSDSEPEVDELSIKDAVLLPMEHMRLSSETQKTVDENEVTTIKPTLKRQTSGAQSPPEAKKARFDGIVIVSKPKPKQTQTKKQVSQTKHGKASSSTGTTSLVDALARTFQANRHVERPFVHRAHARARPDRKDDTSVPQTDVETTDAEDDRRQLNTRLARTPLERWRVRTGRSAGETNSGNATPSLLDVPLPDRPTKRLKPILYEPNAALIDAALGTVEASIGWNAELDFITRDSDDDFRIMSPAVQTKDADDRMVVDEHHYNVSSSSDKGFVPLDSLPATQARVRDERQTPASTKSRATVLFPHLSQSAKFKQRLHAIFGENATVRTDRGARPKRVDLEFFAQFDEPDRESNANVTESSASAISSSTTEEVPSVVASTHITSQSPDVPSVDNSTDDMQGIQIHQVGSVTDTATDADKSQMSGWIAALQRLVKGKVRVDEAHLEAVSIVLAEIESVKDRLDNEMTSRLYTSVKQLAELHDIPYGDRNRLRRRAQDIVQTWSSIGA